MPTANRCHINRLELPAHIVKWIILFLFIVDNTKLFMFQPNAYIKAIKAQRQRREKRRSNCLFKYTAHHSRVSAIVCVFFGLDMYYV